MTIKKIPKKATNNPKASKKGLFPFIFSFLTKLFMVHNINTLQLVVILATAFFMGALSMFVGKQTPFFRGEFSVSGSNSRKEYWLELHRRSQQEYLYYGIAGDKKESKLIKNFRVKTGRVDRPTPLPQALGKKYWKITKKYSSIENLETAPYFLELDIPVEEDFFGPVPYNECNGQCSWEVPGYFGLHCVNGDMTRLDNNNVGSSGCIRHSDEDITYLYNLLEIDEGVRYYIVDR